MKEIRRVYVAGPYSDPHVINVFKNMSRGMRASKELFVKGYSPFCPWSDFHLSLIAEENEYNKVTVERYYKYSLDFLKVCDAIVVLPGWEESKGTLKEIELAKSLNIPIYYGLEAFFNRKEL